MLTYEIINPSDKATFLAPDYEIALTVLVAVGGGFYPGKALERDGAELSGDAQDQLAVPPFFAGDSGYAAWWQSKHYAADPVEVALRTRRVEVITALRSVAYGDARDRRLYDAALEAITDPSKRAAFIATWEDERRSSMTRIMAKAHDLADHLAAPRETEAAS